MKHFALLRYEKTIVFLTGALGYGILELLWRGYTHPSMLLLGGVCFYNLYLYESKYKPLSLFSKCIAGGVLITSLELITGSIVNIALNMNVWDYSTLPLNFLGQICASFFILWTLLCIPVFFMCRKMHIFFNFIYTV